MSERDEFEARVDALVGRSFVVTDGPRHPFSKGGETWGERETVVRCVLAEIAARATQQQAVPEGWREFIEEVAQQTPEKPDYWSSCGQCERNASAAEDLIAANPAEAGDVRARGRAPGQVEAQQGIAGESSALDHQQNIDVAPGWQLVPTTPTDEMLAAMLSDGESAVLAQHRHDPISASAVLRISGVGTRYAEMLAAAPAAPAPTPLHPAFNAADSHMLVTDHAQAGIMSQHNACAYRDTCRAMLPGHDLVPIPEALFEQMLGANSVRDEALEECAGIADALAKEQSGSEETHARAAKAAAEIIAGDIRAKKSTAGQAEGNAS